MFLVFMKIIYCPLICLRGVDMFKRGWVGTSNFLSFEVQPWWNPQLNLGGYGITSMELSHYFTGFKL
jgi:hypothetical protein